MKGLSGAVLKQSPSDFVVVELPLYGGTKFTPTDVDAPIPEEVRKPEVSKVWKCRHRPFVNDLHARDSPYHIIASREYHIIYMMPTMTMVLVWFVDSERVLCCCASALLLLCCVEFAPTSYEGL